MSCRSILKSLHSANYQSVILKDNYHIFLVHCKADYILVKSKNLHWLSEISLAKNIKGVVIAHCYKLCIKHLTSKYLTRNARLISIALIVLIIVSKNLVIIQNNADYEIAQKREADGDVRQINFLSKSYAVVLNFV